MVVMAGIAWCGNTPTRVGKTTMGFSTDSKFTETPPRVWGRPPEARCFRPSRRNTPTRVGKTVRAHPEEEQQMKHPHACGEDSTCVQEVLPRLGNTPTRVGKTGRYSGSARPRWKHPHACGEDSCGSAAVSQIGETPPRVWGRLLPDAVHKHPSGNTPTRVGKTRRSTGKRCASQKHPHACGEDPAMIDDNAAELETPPRVWGRHEFLLASLNSGRNTPTRVGKTSKTGCTRCWTQKHPHACGEDEARLQVGLIERETPPRVWGRQRRALPSADRQRNTPTRVGKTAPS